MSLSDEHRKVYEQSREVAKQEISELDELIEVELAKVRDRLTELQTAKRAALKMYEALCIRLGVPNDLAESDEGD